MILVPIIWTHKELNEEENRMRGVNSSPSKEHELEECGKCGTQKALELILVLKDKHFLLYLFCN